MHNLFGIHVGLHVYTGKWKLVSEHLATSGGQVPDSSDPHHAYLFYHKGLTKYVGENDEQHLTYAPQNK